VFSRTLDAVSWQNTTLVKEDVVPAVRKMKQQPGTDMVILGSGSIVSQLTQAGLVDEYQLVVTPIVLGRGRTLFETVDHKVKLTLTKTRSFKNGNVVHWYEPA
jgi:dihydrofolate reductase